MQSVAPHTMRAVACHSPHSLHSHPQVVDASALRRVVWVVRASTRCCLPRTGAASIHATLIGALHQPDAAWASFRARPADNTVMVPAELWQQS